MTGVMKLPIYQIDAFAERTFQGNPAAVCALKIWLPDHVMQAIAAENNLSETAFYIETEGAYEIRWFTPTREVDLCGHATLATAHVIFDQLPEDCHEINLESRSGELNVTRGGNMLTLDFPLDTATPCDIPPALIKGLGAQPVECHHATDYMAVFKDEESVAKLNPNFFELAHLDLRGVIVTAPGNEVDFVSRFFAPKFGVDEDPVTGSAHCTLMPYWAERLGKDELTAVQISKRTGHLNCKLGKHRVFISGHTIPYLEGFIEVDCEL